MDTLYYRKIAEIVVRDQSREWPPGIPNTHPEIIEIARDALVARNLKKRHKRLLKAYMYDWINRLETNLPDRMADAVTTALTNPSEPKPEE